MTKEKAQEIWIKTLSKAKKEGIKSRLTAYLLYRCEKDYIVSHEKVK